MKIFAAGIATETNTFAPLFTGLRDFTVQRGGTGAPDAKHASLDLSETWRRQARDSNCDFVSSLMAWAMPSGPTVRRAYEALRDELLRDLKVAMPVDIVALNLHGAMVAQGYDSCEVDLLQRVRAITGPKTVVAVELDLHCHLHETLLALADVIVTYKEYPHIDVHERAEELLDLAIATKRGDVKPTMALFDCRMVGMYPTTRSPLREFVSSMKAMEGQERVLSLSFAHGFQFADLPYVGAKMLAITDGDPALAQSLAKEYGLRAYQIRREIGFDGISLPMEAALDRALASKKIPIVVADQSDNVGGGAPGDSTFVLRWLLEHDVPAAAIAIVHDPQVVELAHSAGVGSALRVRLGGKLSSASGDPLDLDVEVLTTRSEYLHGMPQRRSEPWMFELGDVAALRCRGIDIVVGSRRCQCFGPSIFTDLGIDPMSKQLLVPKSYQHFYAGFKELAAEIIYMAAPGAVIPDPKRIAYRRLDTNRMYPWNPDPLGQDM